MSKYEDLRQHMINDSTKDFVQYLSDNITVTPYIPIGRKTAIADIFSKNFAFVLSNMLNDNFSTLSEIFMEYEIRKVFNVLFRYIDIEFDYKYHNSMEYDLIMQSGLYYYILHDAGDDYNKFCELLDGVTGIRDMSIVDLFNKKLNNITPSDIDEMIHKVENIDQTKIDKLMKIAEMNSPLTSQIADIIREDARNNTNKVIKSNNKNNVVKFKK